jgi:hypothetical protein
MSPKGRGRICQGATFHLASVCGVPGKFCNTAETDKLLQKSPTTSTFNSFIPSFNITQRNCPHQSFQRVTNWNKFLSDITCIANLKQCTHHRWVIDLLLVI